jgi:transposase
MQTLNKYVGLDVHKDTTVIAVAEGQRGGEGVTLHVLYKAGPTGHVIYRQLRQLKIDCIVVAPSKLPYEKGVRQKTDRRDALTLARLHRAGELTGIHVPDAVDDGVRSTEKAKP